MSHEIKEEKVLAKLKELLRPGLEQAERGEFVDQTFEEIIAEANRESKKGNQ
jgi:hypothetical protein